jgi:hypothetical protein
MRRSSGVNLVEIDLNRTGDWRALLRPHRCPAKAESPYRATFRVPADPDATYLHPIRLRELLPAISIPLRETDPRVKLNLQALIEHAYDSGRYDRRLDYAKACAPPLDAEDAAWADDLLRHAGKRRTQRG